MAVLAVGRHNQETLSFLEVLALVALAMQVDRVLAQTHTVALAVGAGPAQ